jgi:4-amino-4-deoxy-L-arabinose transferase-like glycosyltransferase
MNDRIGRAWSLVAAALLIVCVFIWLGFEIQKGRLTNTDELVTAERSREMLLTHQWTVQFNFQPSLEKPPLQYWLTTLTLPHIGQHEAAVRIWPLIFGTLTAAALAWLAFLIDRDRSWLVGLSVALLASSPLFLFEVSRALLDSGLMFFVTLAIIFAQMTRKHPAWWLAVAIACGLGTLQKIPLGFLIWLIILIVRFSSVNERPALRSWWLLAAVLLGGTTIAIWPLFELWKFHASLADIFRLQEAVILTGPTRLGARPYLEIPMRLTIMWPVGSFALLAPIWILFSKRAQTEMKEISIVCLAVIVLAIVFNFRSARYMVPLIPCLCLLLAVTLLWLFQKRGLARMTTIIAALSMFIAGFIQAKLEIDHRRKEPADQIEIAQQIGSLQKPDTHTVIVRFSGGSVLYDSFYLFYGDLHYPVTKLSPDQLRVASLPRPAIGVCAAENLPLVREKYGDVDVALQRGDFICWQAKPGD